MNKTLFMSTRTTTSLRLQALLVFSFLLFTQWCNAQHEGPRYRPDTLLISIQNVNGTVDTMDMMQFIRGELPKFRFLDQNQIPITYADLKGKVVFFDFWHLTCPPCIVELPGMELLERKVDSEDFVLLTFSINSYAEICDKLFKRRVMDITIIPQVKLITSRSYPTKILFGRDGAIIDYVGHGSISDEAIQRLIDKYDPLIREALSVIVR